MKTKIAAVTYILTLSLLIFSSSGASAQNTGHRLKFVFPFGDVGTVRVCPVPYQTAAGCCEPPQSIYQYNAELKGCCTPPNEVHGTGTNERCCTPWKTGQARWGQTTEFPCGGYCGAPDVVSSYNGYSSCCSDCPVADGVIAFQTISSVCGTCCSRIPESCGNAGERVCEPGTGSAYCSQSSACNHPNEWLIGSAGEGGYDCCASCEGARWGHTASSCGECCLPTSELVSYNGVFSCCGSIGFNQARKGQAVDNVCGTVCTDPFCFNICTP